MSSDDGQTWHAMAAHYGTGGPAAAADAWLAALFEQKDYVAAWDLMDDRLRLARAQAWAWANRDHPALAGRALEDVAAGLANGNDPLWPPFAEAELAAFRNGMRPDEVDFPDGVGIASRPRPVGVDLELVLFVALDEATRVADLMDPEWNAPIFEQPREVHPFASLTMIHTADGWRVAAHNPDLPEPGWPPRL